MSTERPPEAIWAQLSDIARQQAYAARNDHDYLPQSYEEAWTWKAHDWVIAAMKAAVRADRMFEGRTPSAAAPVAQAAPTGQPAERFDLSHTAGFYQAMDERPLLDAEQAWLYRNALQKIGEFDDGANKAAIARAAISKGERCMSTERYCHERIALEAIADRLHGSMVSIGHDIGVIVAEAINKPPTPSAALASSPVAPSPEPSDWSFAGWFLNSAPDGEPPHWEQVADEHANDPDVCPLGFWVSWHAEAPQYDGVTTHPEFGGQAEAPITADHVLAEVLKVVDAMPSDEAPVGGKPIDYCENCGMAFEPSEAPVAAEPVIVGFVDKDQPYCIAWTPAVNDLADMTPLYAGKKEFKGYLSPALRELADQAPVQPEVLTDHEVTRLGLQATGEPNYSEVLVRLTERAVWAKIKPQEGE